MTGESVTYAKPCPHCGGLHGPRCPEVKAIEYFEDGSIRRIEYLTLSDRGSQMGAPLSELRADGAPRRIDWNLQAPAERAIGDAMIAVENIPGGSVALTEAVTLLSKARNRVADHLEGKP